MLMKMMGLELMMDRSKREAEGGFLSKGGSR